MKRFSQQFHTAAKRVSMTKAESRELKNRLVSYMEYHPLPESARKTNVAETLASEPFWLVQFNTIRTRAYAGMFALLALIVVPFVAEQSVPGDVLYPVKVRFNEEVRSSLAMSPYQQVEWETKRVERRLAEARLLATEGKLTPELEDVVATAVKNHGIAAQAGLAELRETDRDEAAIAELSFASALEVESEVLETEAARQHATGVSTTDTIAAAVADVRAGVASPGTTDVSYERLLARVEDETTQATEILVSLRDEITAQERSDIDRRLADISRKIDQAYVAYATSSTATTVLPDEAASGTASMIAAVTDGRDEQLAKEYLRDALRDTQKLIRFMTDIDVKANVSVEELVPVTPTAEERASQVRNLRNQVNDIVAQINIELVADEKINFGLSRITELMAAAEAATAAQKYDTAETNLNNALSLAMDIQTLLATQAVTDTTTPTDGAAATTTTATTSSTTTVATTSEPVVE